MSFEIEPFDGNDPTNMLISPNHTSKCLQILIWTHGCRLRFSDKFYSGFFTALNFSRNEICFLFRSFDISLVIVFLLKLKSNHFKICLDNSCKLQIKFLLKVKFILNSKWTIRLLLFFNYCLNTPYITLISYLYVRKKYQSTILSNSDLFLTKCW